MPTYTYTDLNGNGNPNVAKNIKHNDKIQDWHFIYFGYSIPNKKAYAYVQFKDSEGSNTYPNVNHYLAEKFWLTVGKDWQAKNPYSGQIAHVAVNTGQGAFREGKNFDHPNDAFGVVVGTNIGKKPEIETLPVKDISKIGDPKADGKDG